MYSVFGNAELHHIIIQQHPGQNSLPNPPLPCLPILKPADPSCNAVVPEWEPSRRTRGVNSRGEVRILHGVQVVNGVSHSGLQGPGF